MHPLALVLPPTETLLALAWLALCIGVCANLSVFASLTIHKAFRRRTRWWIIAGSIGGLFVLAAWVLVIGVTIAAVYQIDHKDREKMQVLSTSRVPQIIQGQNLRYQFVLPPGWAVRWDSKVYDFIAEREGLHLAVGAGKSVGTTTDFADRSRAKIKAESAGAELGDKVSVEIDGRNWLRYPVEIRRDADRTRHGQIYYVYSGDEGMFQFIAWRDQPLTGPDASTLREIANSFRFPLVDITAPATTHAEPQTLQGTRSGYTVTVPGGWLTRRRGAGDYDLQASHGRLNLGVIVEPDVATNSGELLRFAQNRARRREDDPVLSKASTVLIDGRNWLRFSADFRRDGNDYVQNDYVYAGPEGAFQLLGVTRREDYPQDENSIRQVAESFRFPPAPDAAPQIIHGRAMPYLVTLPIGWMAKYVHDAFDVQASRGDAFFAVSAGASTAGTKDALLGIVQGRIRKVDPNSEFGTTSTVRIDGRDWLQFNAKYAANEIPITAHQFLYVGPEGSYQMIGWTTQTQYAQQADLLNEVATSFRFSTSANPGSAPVAVPSPAPSVIEAPKKQK